MKTKNIVIIALAVLLVISVSAHFLVPYYQGKIQLASQQAAQQAAAQAANAVLIAIQQRVTNTGEAVIETQQGSMILVEKKGKKR